jgi:retron-type reverse transcriptase
MWTRRRALEFDIHGLPRIDGISDLAWHAGYSSRHVWWLLHFPERAYRIFVIPKRSGGGRQIAAPKGALKGLQRWILRTVLQNLRVSAASRGFIPGARTRDNAESHVGAIAVLKLDLRDFFSSISIARVTAVFARAGYSRKASSILARICTFKGVLPQGAPSSPYLASLCCRHLDARLSGFAQQQGFVYTRYSDDITVSSTDVTSLAKSRNLIVHIIRESGFQINRSKSRFSGPRQALVVTGLTVRADGVGIGRKRMRQIRAWLHRSHSLGLGDELERMQGWLDYLSDADGDRYRILRAFAERLLREERGSVISTLRWR